jgi:hypothetical protein
MNRNSESGEIWESRAALLAALGISVRRKPDILPTSHPEIPVFP